MASLGEQLKAAVGVSVPLVAVDTPDPAATRDVAVAAINGDHPKVEWDLVRGFYPLNESGREAISVMCAETGPMDGNPIGACALALKLPERSLVFLHMAHRFFDTPAFLQAVWNLRDQFKLDHRMLIMLGTGFKLPAELMNDVLVLDEPLPSPEQLEAIVRDTVDAAGVPADAEAISRSVEAVSGLASFPAEQSIAMSMGRDGVKINDLWERKRKQIEQCDALKVYRTGDKFDDIGGCENVKNYLRRFMAGPDRPNAIVVLDELEKSMGGADSDTSGVAQDQLGVLLTEMQDQGYDGMIMIGPPGAAKTAMAKSAGNEAGVPTVQLDLGAAKGSLVGESERKIRAAMKVIKSVSNGRALFMGTCNSIGNLKPELRRRFTLGTFFFDLPTAEEREKIWQLYILKFGLPMSSVLDRPADDGWTGAEIRQCCRLARSLSCTPVEAAQYIVPVARSAADVIERLRSQCDGKYISASYPGLYRRDGGKPVAPEQGKRRKVQVE